MRRAIGLVAVAIVVLALVPVLAVSGAVGAEPATEMGAYEHAPPALPSPVHEYRVTEGHLVPHGSSEPWLITDGHISWQLFGIFPHPDGQLAVYEVVGFSIEVLDNLGVVHRLTVVPDGLPSPYVTFGIPGFEPDSGAVFVYLLQKDWTLLDGTIYDLSIDGQEVNQSDMIGGPSFGDTYWDGEFPVPTFFSICTHANLPSLNFQGDFYMTGELVPRPVGGAIIPTDKLGLVMPWIMAAALIVVAGVSLAMWNRKRGAGRA